MFQQLGFHVDDRLTTSLQIQDLVTEVTFKIPSKYQDFELLPTFIVIINL